ncbi:MAG TPA: LamG-like jellyroll fold domain-containing protein [Flavobacteriales bacterium]|nr:LamG-like jellyroll fold domain-containing protein [Flavobacteriales bacterium]
MNSKLIKKTAHHILILFTGLTLRTTPASAQSITFNGTGYTLISMPAASDLGTADFTWTCWIKTTDMGAFKSIVGSYSGSSNKFFFGVNGGKFIAAIGNLTSGNSTTTVADGNWHFVAATRLSGNLKVYVDGTMEDSVTNAGNVNSGLGLAFGKYEGSGYHYVGTVDMMSFWDTAHTATQIVEDMNRCSFSGTEPGLIGGFEFNEGSGDSTKDVTNTYTAYFMDGLDTTAAWGPGYVNSSLTAVTNNSPTLTADASGYSYQWVDCNSGFAAISGETSQSFTATANGSYAVVVTQSGCSDTSACESVINIGMEEFVASSIQVYPNPSDGNFTVELGRINSEVQVTVTTFEGKVVRNEQKTNVSVLNMNLMNEPAGVYMLTIITDKTSKAMRLIVK